MPQVPVQTTPTQQLNAGGMPSFQAPDVAPMKNAAPEQADALGKGLLAAGTATMKIGQRIQDDLDDANVTRRISAVTEGASKLATDFRTLQGENAITAMPKFEEDLAALVKDNGGDTPNGVVAKLYQAKADIVMRTARASAYEHFDQQRFKVGETNTKAAIVDYVRMAALAGPNDRDQWVAAANGMVAKLASLYGIPVADDKGVPTPAYKALYAETVADPLAASVVSKMLTDGKYSDAVVYLEKNNASLSPSVYAKLYESATTANEVQNGEDVADALYSGQSKGETATKTPNASFANPVRGAEIHYNFGDPRDGGKRVHHGVDIPAPAGTPVLASRAGTVTATWWDDKYGGGNSVKIDHGGGTETGYAHMQNWIVKPGQHVEQGEVIGYVGSTGVKSSGPHLHFSIRENGQPVNPKQAFAGVRVPSSGSQPSGGSAQGAAALSLSDQLARIDAMGLSPNAKKSAKAKLMQLHSQREAVDNKAKKDNWDLALDQIGSGKVPWNVFAKQNPGVWNSLDPGQRAALEKGRVDDDVDTLVALNDPRNQNTAFVEAEYLAGRLSKDSRDSWMSQLSKGYDAVHAYTEQFNAALVQAGFGKFVDGTKLDEKGKRELIELKSQFEAAVVEKQRTLKKELDWVEQKAVLDQILGNKVAISRAFGRYEVKPMFQVTPDELRYAYVRFGDRRISVASIPPIDRAQIRQALSAVGLPPTETNIVGYYMRKLNKAR